MRSKRDLELPEEALISFFPQMGDIWVLYSGYFMEFPKIETSDSNVHLRKDTWKSRNFL